MATQALNRARLQYETARDINPEAGSDRGVAALEEWACDPIRFDAEWIQATRDTIKAARSI